VKGQLKQTLILSPRLFVMASLLSACVSPSTITLFNPTSAASGSISTAEQSVGIYRSTHPYESFTEIGGDAIVQIEINATGGASASVIGYQNI